MNTSSKQRPQRTATLSFNTARGLRGSQVARRRLEPPERWGGGARRRQHHGQLRRAGPGRASPALPDTPAAAALCHPPLRGKASRSRHGKMSFTALVNCGGGRSSSSSLRLFRGFTKYCETNKYSACVSKGAKGFLGLIAQGVVQRLRGSRSSSLFHSTVFHDVAA